MDARGAQRVGQRRCADEFEGGVDAVGHDRADAGGDAAVVEDRVVDPGPVENVGAGEVAGHGEHGESGTFDEDGGGEPYRGGAAPDQEGLSGPGVEPYGQGSVGGLQHLRNRAESGGVEVAAERDDLGDGDAGYSA